MFKTPVFKYGLILDNLCILLSCALIPAYSFSFPKVIMRFLYKTLGLVMDFLMTCVDGDRS